MPANQLIPWFRPGQDITGKVTGANITGKRCVAYAAGGTAAQPNIVTATAGAHIAGVAGHDQAVDGYVHFSSAGVLPITAGADITANTLVSVGADGTVVPAAAPAYSDGTTAGAAGTVIIGRAVADAANGADAPIHLSL